MVLCLVSIVNAHVEIIIPRGSWERFCQPKPSGCVRHTSGVKVNYQMNSKAFYSLALRTMLNRLLHDYGKDSIATETHVRPKHNTGGIYIFALCGACTTGYNNGRNSVPCCNLTLSLQFFLISWQSLWKAISGALIETSPNCLTVIKRPQMRPGLTDW